MLGTALARSPDLIASFRGLMTSKRLHRERVRSAYLHLFALMILLPAILPLPLLFVLPK